MFIEEKLLALYDFLRELVCWHQWKGCNWGWNTNGNAHSGEYWCIHCGAWIYTNEANHE